MEKETKLACALHFFAHLWVFLVQVRRKEAKKKIKLGGVFKRSQGEERRGRG